MPLARDSKYCEGAHNSTVVLIMLGIKATKWLSKCGES